MRGYRGGHRVSGLVELTRIWSWQLYCDLSQREKFSQVRVRTSESSGEIAVRPGTVLQSDYALVNDKVMYMTMEVNIFP